MYLMNVVARILKFQNREKVGRVHVCQENKANEFHTHAYVSTYVSMSKVREKCLWET